MLGSRRVLPGSAAAVKSLAFWNLLSGRGACIAGHMCRNLRALAPNMILGRRPKQRPKAALQKALLGQMLSRHPHPAQRQSRSRAREGLPPRPRRLCPPKCQQFPIHQRCQKGEEVQQPRRLCRPNPRLRGQRRRKLKLRPNLRRLLAQVPVARQVPALKERRL